MTAVSEPPVARVDRRKKRTRRQLVDAARRILVSRATTDVSIQDITDEADVGLGSFYNHLSSKAELGDVQLVALGDVHRAARPDHPDLRQRQHALHPPARPQPRHPRHHDAGGGLLHVLPGQVAPRTPTRRRRDGPRPSTSSSPTASQSSTTGATSTAGPGPVSRSTPSSPVRRSSGSATAPRSSRRPSRGSWPSTSSTPTTS